MKGVVSLKLIKEKSLKKINSKNNYLTIAVMLILLILSFQFRFIFLEFQSEDYVLFLKSWIEYMKDNGGVFSLSNPPGNYSAPYTFILSLISYLDTEAIIIIKYISIVFDYFIAIVGACIVYELVKSKENKLRYSIISFLILIFSPIILINSSMWGQCDSIYGFFVILSIYLMIINKYKLSYISYGIAFAFKLQSIFILPIYLILYLKKKEISIFNFVYIIIPTFILSLPAMVFGYPLSRIFTIYIQQSAAYENKVVFNFPNIYNFINPDKGNVIIGGILFTLILFLVITALIVASKKELDGNFILKICIVFLFIATCFLPKMHERYLYIGEILIILLCVIEKKYITIALSVNYTTFITYFRFMIRDVYVNFFATILLFIFAVLIYLVMFIYEICECGFNWKKLKVSEIIKEKCGKI